MSDSNDKRRSAIPTGIWVLGFVSLLMDVSSEMIHALFPVYLVGVLGASTLTVGIIEGIAEATAFQPAKDRPRKRHDASSQRITGVSTMPSLPHLRSNPPPHVAGPGQNFHSAPE